MKSGTVSTLHKAWIKVAAMVVFAFAPILLLAALGYTEPARWCFDLLSWPLDGNFSFTSPDLKLVCAIFAGILLGWTATLWCLSEWVYDLAPEQVRKTVLVGIVSWFVLDSTGSILSGHASNAVFNILFLVIAAGPLWFRAEATKND